ncbi:anti-sigma regulatory factor [Marinifilum sp. JC120]|nr:anti-sigma regulatory factor [Marinifilum sp. JC120]
MSRLVLEQEEIELAHISDNVLALSAARHMAERIGFNEVEQSLIATAVSELSTNAVRYGRGGVLILRHISNCKREGIEVEATDSGPGIADIDQALTDSYSTAQSLGLGLPGVKRIMDEFVIESSEECGTQCLARKWR